MSVVKSVNCEPIHYSVLEMTALFVDVILYNSFIFKFIFKEEGMLENLLYSYTPVRLSH